MTGVLFGVILFPSVVEVLLLAVLSVTGDNVIFLFLCLSRDGGVPKMPCGRGEIGISSPLLPLLRSDRVCPSSRYSVTLPAKAFVELEEACVGLPTSLTAESSTKSNEDKSHQPSVS